MPPRQRRDTQEPHDETLDAVAAALEAMRGLNTEGGAIPATAELGRAFAMAAEAPRAMLRAKVADPARKKPVAVRVDDSPFPPNAVPRFCAPGWEAFDASGFLAAVVRAAADAAKPYGVLMALLADPLPPGRVPAALDRVNVAVKRSTDLLTALFRPDMPEHAALLREFFPPGSSMPAGPLSQELIAQLAVLLLPRILPLYRRIAMDYSEDLRRMAWGAYVIEFLLHIEITGKPPAHEEEATRRYNDLFHPMFVSAAVGISHLATAAPCRGRLAEDVLLLDALSVGAVSGPLFCCTLRADSLGGQDQDALAVEIQNGMAPFLNILLEHPKPWRDHSNTENYPAAAAAHEHLRALSERRGCSPALKQMARIYVQAIGSAQRWDGAGAGPDWPETYAAIRERVAASGRVADRCDACSAAAETLKRCARCRIARYCSEACLRAAWKAGHKDVCVDAKSLRQDDDEGLSSRVVELMKDMDDVTGRVVDDMLGKGEAERIFQQRKKKGGK